MELRLRNYQSWSQAEVSLDGLTILVGSSGLGKSCFGRALKRCLRNDVPTGHIKLGTPKVELDLNWRGLSLHVERGAKAKDSTVYTVNGQTYEKLGGAVPAEIQAMSFGPVEINGVTIDPLFAGQFDSQFMVGASPAELNAVLKAFASTEKLDRGRKVLAGRITDINAQAKALTPIISGLEEQENTLGLTLASAAEPMATIRELTTKVERLERAKACTCIALMGMVTSRAYQDKVDQLTMLETKVPASVRLLKTLYRVQTQQVATELLCSLIPQGKAITATAKTSTQVQATTRAAVAHRVIQAARTRQGGLQTWIASLDALTDPLNTCLIRYKALVRVKSVGETDPETPRRKAQMIHALSTAQPSKLVSAAIIVGRHTQAHVLRMANTTVLLDVDRDLKGLRSEQQDLESQITEARASGAIVTCPKCKAEFATAHTH